MAHNYVRYRGYVFRIRDGQWEIIVALMVQEGREALTDRPEFCDALDRWHETLKEWFPGISIIRLDGVWQTNEGQNVIVSLLDRAEAWLAEFDECVPSTLLASITYGTNWVDVRVDFIRDGIEKVRNFIRDPATVGHRDYKSPEFLNPLGPN